MVNVIKAQKIPKRTEPAVETIARFCFHFPQYKFEEARQLPFKNVALMLRMARKERARQMYELTQIMAAPHTDKGKGVKKMLNYFQKQME